MLLPGALFKLKMRMRPGALPRTPLEKLTELPDPVAGFQGADSRQRRGGKEEKGGGSVPNFFFYNLMTA